MGQKFFVGRTSQRFAIGLSKQSLQMAAGFATSGTKALIFACRHTAILQGPQDQGGEVVVLGSVSGEAVDVGDEGREGFSGREGAETDCEFR